MIRYVVKDHITARKAAGMDESIETVAEGLESSESTLYAWMSHEDNATSRPMPVPKMYRLYEMTGDERLPQYIFDRFRKMGYSEDADVPKVDLAKARIEGEDWSHREMRGLEAPGAVLVDVDLQSTILTEATLDDATLVRCKLDRARLIRASCERITLVECSLVESDLTWGIFKNLTSVQSNFRDCWHSVADFRDARFHQTPWFADRYRGGRLVKGASIEGLIGVSESHMIVAEIVNRIAGGRKHFEMLAGWIWAKYSGCWQAVLHCVYEYFTDSEQQELLDAWFANPGWLIELRLDYEHQKREWLMSQFGGDFPTWPDMKTRNAAIKGQRFTVRAFEGQASSVGLFVPDDSDKEPRFDTWRVTSDEMLMQAMVKRGIAA